MRKGWNCNAQTGGANGVTAPGIHIGAYSKCLPCSRFSVVDPDTCVLWAYNQGVGVRHHKNLCTPLVGSTHLPWSSSYTTDSAKPGLHF